MPTMQYMDIGITSFYVEQLISVIVNTTIKHLSPIINNNQVIKSFIV